MPPRSHPERSPWALIITVVVVILFGLFWLWQKNEVEEGNTVSSTPIISDSSNTPTNTTPDFSALEANAVNISIPDFDTVF